VRAKKEFAELLQLIPEQDRWHSPLKPDAKNLWPVLAELHKNFLSCYKVLEKEFPDAAERSEFEDAFWEAEELPIPWPNEQHHKLIRKYVKANQDFEKRLVAAIATHDFCSEFKTQDYSYSETLFDFEVQIARESLLFLKTKVLLFVRAQDWKAALTQIEIMRRFVRLGHETKGFLVHGLIQGAFVGQVRDAAMRLAKHPSVPNDVLEQIKTLVVSLAGEIPKMAHYHRLELQQFMVNMLAQIPVTKNVRDQVPALMLLGYRNLRGDDVVFEEEKEGGTPTASESQDIMVDAALERAIPCLADHPAPFDKSQTIQHAWKHHQAFFTELDKHKFPSLTLKPPEELLIYYRALSQNLPQHMALEHILSGAKSVEPEPLPEKEIERLRKVFRAQANPLGQLFYASFCSNTINNPQALDLAIQHEYQLAVEVQLACLMFERQEKRRPKTWAELIAKKLLAGEPVSPYSGEVFGYDPKRGEFWRQGKDGSPIGQPPKPPDEDDPSFILGTGIYSLINVSEKP
jgi:hypothetical protein